MPYWRTNVLPSVAWVAHNVGKAVLNAGGAVTAFATLLSAPTAHDGRILCRGLPDGAASTVLGVMLVSASYECAMDPLMLWYARGVRRQALLFTVAHHACMLAWAVALRTWTPCAMEAVLSALAVFVHRLVLYANAALKRAHGARLPAWVVVSAACAQFGGLTAIAIGRLAACPGHAGGYCCPPVVEAAPWVVSLDVAQLVVLAAMGAAAMYAFSQQYCGVLLVRRLNGIAEPVITPMLAWGPHARKI